MTPTLLIANRGEIACRILRTARRLGWRTVAVYSDADHDALHVRMADTAYRIGPPPAAESYLVQENLLDAARRAGAGYIHPGYGFLAENASFAAACEREGIVFVGPTAPAIEAMGDKSAAKHRMEQAGVPCLPGYHGNDQSEDSLARAAGEIGFPVLLKPSAGGGGKGMHIVHDADAFPGLLETARREARGAFGDDRMLIEKYLERARHVEIQVFRDTHGNAVYLFERDCSVQRRHQKIIEEAPAPGVDEALRRQMGEAAVQAAAAIDYRGAGTVEFLLAPDQSFYFMEMNTRLQVEHPVTEMITGQDLVAWQLMVARGQPLPARQEDLAIRGHAVEARVYAEDPARDFLPSTGRYAAAHLPRESAQLRVDSAIPAGVPGVVSQHYDPMLAKVIAHGDSREEAIERLAGALSDVCLPGIVTNARFVRTVLSHEAFRAGKLSTRFLEDHAPATDRDPAEIRLALQVAAMRRAAALEADRAECAAARGEPGAPWARANGWRLNAAAETRLEFIVEGDRHAVTLEALPPGPEGLPRYAGGDAVGEVHGDQVHLVLNDQRLVLRAVCEGGGVTVFLPDGALQCADWTADAAGAHPEEDGACHAPMSGSIVQVKVSPGDAVRKGASLVVMEAMKMEHTLRAPTDGTVRSVLCAVGDLVQEGQALLEMEEPA